MRVEVIESVTTCNHEFEMNSGLLFGQSVFTSSIICEGKVPYLNDHLERLRAGAMYLFNLRSLDFSHLEVKLKELLQNSIDLHHSNYLRMTILKKSDELVCLLSLGVKPNFTDPVSLKVHPTMFNNGMPAFVKVGNYSYQFREKELAQREGFDDVLFVNEVSNNFLDVSTSNIFFTIGETIYTAPLQSGVFDGILRKQILTLSQARNIEVVENNISYDRLSDFDGAFITNSFSGIRVVKRIDEFKFNESKLIENFKNDGNLWKRKN